MYIFQGYAKAKKEKIILGTLILLLVVLGAAYRTV